LRVRNNDTVAWNRTVCFESLDRAAAMNGHIMSFSHFVNVESVWQNYAPHLLSRPLLPSFFLLTKSFNPLRIQKNDTFFFFL
jgi:hypothetical protein